MWRHCLGSSPTRYPGWTAPRTRNPHLIVRALQFVSIDLKRFIAFHDEFIAHTSTQLSLTHNLFATSSSRTWRHLMWMQLSTSSCQPPGEQMTSLQARSAPAKQIGSDQLWRERLVSKLMQPTVLLPLDGPCSRMTWSHSHHTPPFISHDVVFIGHLQNTTSLNQLTTVVVHAYLLFLPVRKLQF